MTALNYRGLNLGEIVQQDPNLGTQYRDANGQLQWFNDPYTTQDQNNPGSFTDNPGSADARMANFNANGPAGGVSESQLQAIAQGQPTPTPIPQGNSFTNEAPPLTPPGGGITEIQGSGGQRPTWNRPVVNNGSPQPMQQYQDPQRAYTMGGQNGGGGSIAGMMGPPGGQSGLMDTQTGQWLGQQRQAQPQYAGPAYYGPQNMQQAYGGYGGYQGQPFQMQQPQFPQWNPGYGGYQSQFQFQNPYMGSVGSGMGGYGGGASYGQPPTSGGGGAAPGGNPQQQLAPQYSPPTLPNGINPNLIGTQGYNQYTGYGQQSPYQNPYQQQSPPQQYGMGYPSPYGNNPANNSMGYGGYPMQSAPINGTYPQRQPTQSHPYTGPPLAWGGVGAYQGTSTNGGGYGSNLYSGMASNPNMYGAQGTGMYRGPGAGPSSGGSYNSQAMSSSSPFYMPPRQQQQNPYVGHATIVPTPPPAGSTGYSGSAGGLYGGMAGTGY